MGPPGKLAIARSLSAKKWGREDLNPGYTQISIFLWSSFLSQRKIAPRVCLTKLDYGPGKRY